MLLLATTSKQGHDGCLQAVSEADHHPLDADAEEGAASSAPSATVYVKNLAFATADSAMRKHFDQAVSAAGGVMRSAVVHKSQPKAKAKQPAGGKEQKLLSSGFGFVECSSEGVAKAVIKRMQVRRL